MREGLLVGGLSWVQVELERLGTKPSGELRRSRVKPMTREDNFRTGQEMAGKFREDTKVSFRQPHTIDSITRPE